MSYNSFETRQRVRVHPENCDNYLEKHNPYISQYEEGYLLISSIEIPSELFEKALKIENMSCGIRIMCTLDCLLGLYYLRYNFFMGLVCSLISFNGYLSTIYYKKSLLCCYLMYQYLQVLTRLANVGLVIYFYNTQQDSVYFNITNGDFNTNVSNTTHVQEIRIFMFNEPIFDIFVGLTLLGLQIFVTCFIREYYNLLPTREEKNRITFNTV